MALFLSTIVNKVDRKGRVSVPSGFRASLATQSFAGIVAFPSFRTQGIECGGIDRLDEMSARLDQLDQFSEAHEALQAIFADAHQLPFDNEGRIVLPDTLAQHAGITDSAAFVGLGRSFQIWAPETHRRHQEEMRERARRQGLTIPAARNGAPGTGDAR